MGTLHYLKGKAGRKKASPPGGPTGEGPESWGRLVGMMFREQGWERLESLCLRWAKDEPNNALPWFLLSHAYMKMGNYGEMAPAFSEALRLNDQAEYMDRCYNNGICWAIAGLQDKALEWFKELRKYNPKRAEQLLKIALDLGDIDMMWLWRESEKMMEGEN